MASWRSDCSRRAWVSRTGLNAGQQIGLRIDRSFRRGFGFGQRFGNQTGHLFEPFSKRGDLVQQHARVEHERTPQMYFDPGTTFF